MKYEVRSSHHFRQCHPETCSCKTNYVVLKDGVHFMDVETAAQGEVVAALLTSDEPIVIVNGVLLPLPAAMTFRVALESFAASLHDNGLGDDEHGKFMVSAYQKQINYIRSCIFGERSDHVLQTM